MHLYTFSGKFSLPTVAEIRYFFGQRTENTMGNNANISTEHVRLLADIFVVFGYVWPL